MTAANPFSVQLTDRADRMARLPGACAQLAVALEKRYGSLRKIGKLLNVATAVGIVSGLVYCGVRAGEDGVFAFGRVVAVGLILSGYLAAFTRMTTSRVVHPDISTSDGRGTVIGLTIFLSLFVATFGGALLFAFADGPQPPFAVHLGLAASGVILVRWAVGQSAHRYKNVTLDKDEIEWLASFLDVLLEGLGPYTRCTVLCSPFQGPWGRKRVDPGIERAGYSYHAAIDPLCDVGVVFPGGQSFRFASSISWRSKYKNRKNKYKGTKYKVRQEYHFQFDELKDPELAKAAMQAAVTKLGVTADADVATTVKAKPGHATVIQVLKVTGRGEGRERPRLGASPSAQLARGLGRALELALHGGSAPGKAQP